MTKLRLGMVGGGAGAFIGEVHRMASSIDGQYQLVCGAFSSDPKRSVESGRALGLDEARCYESYQTMFEQEAAKSADERMQVVSIVTPNHMHFAVSKMALEMGFHVICDKPATFTLDEAIALKPVVEASSALYALTHTYNGYPMVKQARHMVANGDIGKVRKIFVEYSQGWLGAKDDEGSKQASWRLDPKFAGVSCCMGDIGVHAANLAEYIGGTEISAMSADLGSVVEGRVLDDDGSVLLRFDNGARGLLTASQIAIGEENNLFIKVYGETGALEWYQQEPNSLLYKQQNGATQILRTGVGELCEAAQAATRTPAGHPEGYLEAFANIYVNFAKQIHAHEQGETTTNEAYDVPGIKQAVRGMAFIEQTVSSSQSDTKWQSFQISAQSK